MADTLLTAKDAAEQARAEGRDALPAHELARIRNRYRGALAHGREHNTGRRGPLAEARTLHRRFERYEDMILRFATNLAVPFSNNLAERDQRPVKVQQRTSCGCWRTLQGLADFAVVQSYLSTVGKWGRDKLDALVQLFTTGAWPPLPSCPGLRLRPDPEPGTLYPWPSTVSIRTRATVRDPSSTSSSDPGRMGGSANSGERNPTRQCR
jgi:transposase